MSTALNSSTDGDVLLLSDGTAYSELLGAVGSATGWRINAVNLGTGGAADPVDRISELLSRPESPDRTVLIGAGGLGVASLTVADRHPERVVAVVVLSVPSEPPEAEMVSCPILVLPTGMDASAATRVGSFLDEVAGAFSGVLPARIQPGPITPERLNDPETVGRLRAAGPAHLVSMIGRTPNWVLTGHEVTTTAMADSRLLGETELTAGFRLGIRRPSSAHRGEQDLVTVTADEHSHLRRLVAQHLGPRRVEAMAPQIRRETDRLLDAIDPGAVTDLVSTFTRPLPIIVLCDLIGVPPIDRGYFEEWLVRRMSALPPDPHPDIDDYLVRLIATKQRAPGNDLITAMIRAEADDVVVDDLVSALRWVMVGGHRAPSALLANGVAALLREPEQWRQLCDHPQLIEPAVEELLRHVTPFPVGIARTAAVPLAIGPVTIPAGALVAASLVAANHDPARFVDPDALDVTRGENPHLAFGHGHHYCIGAALARRQLQIAIGALTHRFPQLRLAGDARDLHYRQNRVRYLLELPVVAGPDGSRPATASVA